MYSRIVSTIAGNADKPGKQDGTCDESRFISPRAIAIQNDNIVIIDGDRIRAIDINKKKFSTILKNCLTYIDRNGNKVNFDSPRGVCIMKDQTIIVSNEYNNHILSININGDIKIIAGSIAGFQDGLGTIAKFHHPREIVLSSDNTIIIYDFQNSKIRRLYYK